MIRALQRLVRFVAWIMSPDKLESATEDPPGRLRDSGRSWLFAPEELPDPPPSAAAHPHVTGGWRQFFLAPEHLDDAGSEPTNGPRGPARSFLRELFAAEPLGPEAGEEATPHQQGFLQQLFSREHLGTPDSEGRPTTHSASAARFLRWLFSSEAIDRNGRTGSIEAPLSRRS